jgi:hypothetical protein
MCGRCCIGRSWPGRGGGCIVECRSRGRGRARRSQVAAVIAQLCFFGVELRGSSPRTSRMTVKLFGAAIVDTVRGGLGRRPNSVAMFIGAEDYEVAQQLAASAPDWPKEMAARSLWSLTRYRPARVVSRVIAPLVVSQRATRRRWFRWCCAPRRTHLIVRCACNGAGSSVRTPGRLWADGMRPGRVPAAPSGRVLIVPLDGPLRTGRGAAQPTLSRPSARARAGHSITRNVDGMSMRCSRRSVNSGAMATVRMPSARAAVIVVEDSAGDTPISGSTDGMVVAVIQRSVA